MGFSPRTTVSLARRRGATLESRSRPPSSVAPRRECFTGGDGNNGKGGENNRKRGALTRNRCKKSACGNSDLFERPVKNLNEIKASEALKKDAKTFDKVATLCETPCVDGMNSDTKQNRRNYENETDHQSQRIPRLHISLARRGRKPRRPRATLGIPGQKAQTQSLRRLGLQMRGITARGLRNPRTVDQRQPGVSDHPGNRDGNRRARELSSAVRRESLKLQESDWRRLEELAAATASNYSGKPSWRRMILRIARGEITVRETKGVARRSNVRSAGGKEAL